MKKIIITQIPYANGYEGATYALHTDEGKQSIYAIFDAWYCASARDEEGNYYRVVWEVTDREALERGEEDICCDWEEPAEIVDEHNRPLNLDDIELIEGYHG